MATVSISDVGKSFGAVEVLRNVSAELEDGEFLILVGPSGCGKSTLLRMIAGLESITTGTVRIGDRVVNTVPPNERDIAMVFQNYALYPQMTVAQNMGFALSLARVPKAEIAARVAATAQVLGLDSLLDRYPRHLSGGQRQRVAMGRAIMREPAVFLFDEPLSNLDAQLRVRMRAEIKTLQRRLGTTSIYVTHDQVEAMTMADRIVVMNGGRVEQMGAPLDLFDRPANRFVATFIGSPSMNFLRGTLATEGGPALLTADGARLPLAALPAGRGAGDAVDLGIRPEHVVLRPDDGAEAAVEVVEPMGSETLLTLLLGTERLAVLVRDRLAIRPGETLHVGFMPGAEHFFDPDSGQRL